MDKKIKLKKTSRVNFGFLEEKNEWLPSSQYVQAITQYDKNGNVLIDVHYSASGETDSKNEFVYDENGFLVREVIYIDDKEIAETHLFENNEKGLPVKEVVEYQEGGRTVVSYAYNDDGKLLEKIISDDDGEVEEIFKNEYSGGNLIREIACDGDNELMEEVKYTFDEENNLIEIISWNREDLEKGKLTHEYNEKGQRICSKTYNCAGQLIARSKMLYNEKGQLFQNEDEDQLGVKITTLSYDNNDNIILQEEYTNEEEVDLRIERVFDDSGELVNSSVYVNRHGQLPDLYYSVNSEFEYYE